MRVLLVTQYYPPEPVGKFADLAHALVAQGHEVEVVTGSPCYPLGAVYPGFSGRSGTERIGPGLFLTRVWQVPDHSRSAIRRVLYYCSFALSAATRGLWRTGRIDVVVAYQAAAPTGVAAWFLARLKRARLVLDVVDLWPESVVASGMLRSRSALGLIRRVTRWLYRRSDRINVITEGYRRRLLAEGVPHEKISQIYQWPAARPDSSVVEGPDLGPGTHVVYAGAVGPCQQLGVVLDAAERLRDRPDLHWWIVGEGVERDRLRREAGHRGLRTIHFLGQVSSEEAARWQAAADLLLIHLAPSPMARLSIPSKFFGCLASGRPLLVGVEGETDALARRLGCGLTFRPADPETLTEAVRAFLRLPERERRELGERGLRAFDGEFSRERLIDRFISLLESSHGEREPALTSRTPKAQAA